MRKAGLLIGLVGFGTACGEVEPVRHLDGGTTSDSPMQMIDAPAQPQPVTVTVKLGGIGQQGVVVHFQNADSSLVATETTDATGMASRLMNAGGFVSAIDPFPPQQVPSVLAGLSQGPDHDIRSFAGVKPGDQLRIEQQAEIAGTSMNITLPPQTNANIAYYDIIHTCDGGSSVSGTGSAGSNPTGQVSFYGCASADILVVSRDFNSQPLDYFFVANQAITADGTLDYSNKTFSGLSQRTYTLGDQPQNVLAMNVDQQIATTRGRLGGFSASPSGMPAVATVSFPNIPNGLSVIQVDGRTNNMTHSSLDWGALSTTSYTTNFGSRMLIEATAYTFDAATHSASWTQSAGIAPDFMSVMIAGTRTAPTEYRNVRWQIVAPYTAGTVTLPTLPVGTFDLNFTANDDVGVQGAIFGKVPGGYDSVRPIFYAVMNPFEIAVGPSGSAQFAYPSFGKQALATKRAAPKKTVLQHRTQSTH